MLTAPAAGIVVSNGDGLAGDPTLALANDLAALEALSGTNTIYYRSATDTWSPVTVSGELGFAGGTLGSALGTMATQGAGNVAIMGGTAAFETLVVDRGMSALGHYHAALDVAQTTSGGRYLLLARKGLGTQAVQGAIVGRRSPGSGSGTRNADVYVKILANNGGSASVHWECRGVAGVALVELTFGGEVWYALDAITTAASATFDQAAFTGYCTGQAGQLSWQSAANVSGVAPVTTSETLSLGGVAWLNSAGLELAAGRTLRIDGAPVVGARKAGWSTATGTANRTGFNTATVTTAQLAERVKALIDDLHAASGHGLIGA